MSGYPSYELKPTTPSFRFDRLNSCYGSRMEAWDKCESCPHIERCSADTLMKTLAEKGYRIDTNQYGELVYVDVEKEKGSSKEDST